MTSARLQHVQWHLSETWPWVQSNWFAMVVNGNPEPMMGTALRVVTLCSRIVEADSVKEWVKCNRSRLEPWLNTSVWCRTCEHSLFYISFSWFLLCLLLCFTSPASFTIFTGSSSYNGGLGMISEWWNLKKQVNWMRTSEFKEPSFQ